MNYKEYEALQTELHNKRISLNRSKSHDYANDVDILSNFKRIGQCIELLGISKMDGTMLYCFVMMLMKLDRWGNLIRKSDKPMNESIEDTVMDLHNYIDLTYANLKSRLILTSTDIKNEKED